MMQVFMAIALLWVSLISCSAWIPPAATLLTRRRASNTRIYASSSDSTMTTSNVMGGISDFEEWFDACPKASCLSSIKHASFEGDSLRGLSFLGEGKQAPDGPVVTVPSSLVLSTPYPSDDWDTELAIKLWNECIKGKQSDVYGYCSLLSLGGAPTSSSNVPPSTAPNALRHWTEEQLAPLKTSETGRKLLQALESQRDSWNAKYTKLSSPSMSREEFDWCMQVVHSRAFCGIGGDDGKFSLAAAGAPILAGAAGAAYIQSTPFPDDKLLILLAALGALPVVANFFAEEKGNAVLLPFIDSANHDETADSVINYNPISSSFELSIGNDCLKRDDNGKTQVYVTYGKKSDSELLLNYGFLPQVSFDDKGTSEEARNAQRRQLANAFLERNP